MFRHYKKKKKGVYSCVVHVGLGMCFWPELMKIWTLQGNSQWTPLELCGLCWCGYQVGSLGPKGPYPRFAWSGEELAAGLSHFASLEKTHGIQLPWAPTVAWNHDFHHPSRLYPTQRAAVPLLWTRHSGKYGHHLCNEWTDLQAAKSRAVHSPCLQLTFPREDFGAENRLWKGHKDRKNRRWYLLQKNSVSSCCPFSSPLDELRPKHPYSNPLFLLASFLGLFHGEIPGCQTPGPLQGNGRNLGSAIPFSSVFQFEWESLKLAISCCQPFWISVCHGKKKKK